MTDKLERIERAKAAMLPLVNEHMDPALRDAWLTDLATAALASSSVPEQDEQVESLVEQLNERARLIVNLLAIIKFGNSGFAGDIHISRARQIIDGLPEAIALGEADYRAWCKADPEHRPEGTADALATCAHMLETYGPDCFPANEQGQVHFARGMMDATAAEIRAYLAANAPPPPAPQDRGASQEDGR